jgi:UDP-N-acetylmuramate--alanine ligase
MTRPGERVHIIGIGGSGAAGAAWLLHRAGVDVDGCDADLPSPYTPPLQSAGIRTFAGHDAAHLAGVDRVAISPAVRSVDGHPELAAAVARGIEIVTWQALLGELMAEPGRLGLAVTGTHGKSTTTALLGHLLIHAGMDPTVEVGAVIADWGGSVRHGGGAPFLVEADEFGDNFLNYRPAAAIVTNVEMDHPDYFADEAAVLDSFERFVRLMSPDPRLGGRLLFAGAGSGGVDTLLARLGDWKGRIVRYGPGGEIEASSVEYDEFGTRFTLFDHPFEMTLAGEHNVRNATAALALARTLGAPLESLAQGLRTFRGAGRRMELIADTACVLIYDDYGHHPTEVRAALAAVRQKVGNRRLWAAFEPHMYSRTRLFLDDFAESFRGADEVLIVDIFASRDADTTITSPEELADAVERVSAVPTLATGSAEETAAYLAEHVRSGEAVLVIGAGKSYRVARDLAARLAGEGAA